MGRPIVYCSQCGRSLPEEEFTRGRAHTVEHHPFCIACRPMEAPAPEPKPAPKGSSSRFPAPPPKTTRRASGPAPTGAPSSERRALVFAVAGGIALLVVILSVVMSGRREPPPEPAPPPPSPRKAAPESAPKPPPRTAEEIEKEKKAQREREQAAQLDAAVASLRDIVAKGWNLSKRRFEIESMFDATLKIAGDRKGELEKLRSEFHRRASLVAHWKLDETGGGTAEDATGNGHSGELSNGPAPTPGRIGGAFEFDGTDDGVVVNAVHDLSSHAGPQGAMTLSAWFKASRFPPGAGQGRTPILAKGAPVPGWEYALYVYSNGGLGFSLWMPVGSDVANANGGKIGAGEWHHVAGVLEKGRSIRLYLDGTLAAQSTAFAGETEACAAPFYIARRGDGQHCAGSVDDVRVYTRALGDAEILALFQETK
jgi:concanavalin A-like lectin/glucanase superfamily protein